MSKSSGFMSIATILAYSFNVPTYSIASYTSSACLLTLFHTTSPSQYPPMLQVLTTNNRSAHISQLRQHRLYSVSQAPIFTQKSTIKTQPFLQLPHSPSSTTKEEEKPVQNKR